MQTTSPEMISAEANDRITCVERKQYRHSLFQRCQAMLPSSDAAGRREREGYGSIDYGEIRTADDVPGSGFAGGKPPPSAPTPAIVPSGR